MYCAIIGDMVNSRKLENRYEMQEHLKKILNEVNRNHADAIASDFTVTLGDEFQGVLKNTAPLLSIVESIEMRMFPVRVRFGIGIGALSTEIDRNSSIGADGPAYYYAREGIQQIKKEENRKRGQITDMMIVSEHEQGNCASLMNELFAAVAFIKKKWSVREREIVYDMLTHRDGQEATAARLGIAQSSVQRGLERAGYYTYLKAKEVLEDAIAKEWRISG